MKDSEIIVIGGGAAGLMAAAGAAMNGGRVTVIEKMPRPGRKIMITGKGRCNFSNVKPWEEFASHIHPGTGLLRPAFYNLPPEKMSDFLEDNGLETVVERGDRAFPASHKSSDVVDTLVSAVKKAGAEILCGKEVISIGKRADGDGFSVECSDKSTFSCKKLIITTGGLSYPASGSTGDGLKWAEGLGITVTETFPSLTAIVPEGYKIHNGSNGQKHIDRNTPMTATGKSLCGIQLKNITVSAYIDGNKVCEEFGDIDFTDGGLEGPAGFRISRKCVYAMIHGSKVHVVIDLKPAVSEEQLDRRIASLWKEISEDSRSRRMGHHDKFRILLGKLVPRELAGTFLMYTRGDDVRRLAKALKSWKMNIAGYVGYERCVITAGGISASEVKPKTLECKKIPGLYFAGEILDLDGDTGGYNLQIAFSTGYLAGQSAAISVIQARTFPSLQV